MKKIGFNNQKYLEMPELMVLKRKKRETIRGFPRDKLVMFTCLNYFTLCQIAAAP